MRFPRISLQIAAYVILALGVAGSFAYTSTERTHIKKEALIACLDNEKQNDHLRDEAREDYARLDETLELLGIKKTPAIERRARQNRDETLRRFRERKCPRNGS